MSINTVGNFLKVTTFGESHGEAIGVIIDGVPAGIPINAETDIQSLVDKRKPGASKFTSPRREPDKVVILSGIFEGKTLGTPIAMVIANTDCNSGDYEAIKNSFRPNHGDYTWYKKFNIRDYRGGGRSSARETVARVAAGAIARKILQVYGIEIYGALIQIGSISINYDNWQYDQISKNKFFAPDTDVIPKWEALLESIIQEGDSVGAKIELRATNMPEGIGEPVFDKLDAEIAKAIMSIPAVKAVEIGIGIDAVNARGSEIADEMNFENNRVNFASNHSGGIQGGISNGNDIIIKFTVKPTSSIKIAKQSLSKTLKVIDVVTKGRHDPCVGIRAVPIGEAMLAITLADQLLLHRARYNFYHPLNK